MSKVGEPVPVVFKWEGALETLGGCRRTLLDPTPWVSYLVDSNRFLGHADDAGLGTIIRDWPIESFAKLNVGKNH